MPEHQADVTTLLREIQEADPARRKQAQDQLFRLVQAELKRVAQRRLRREAHADPLLQPTALVDDAFLKLVGGKRVSAKNRVQFFCFAARAMRQVLVSHARKRQARGGDKEPLSLHESHYILEGKRSVDVLALHEALATLAELDPRQAQVVELRCFGGLTLDEIADALDISVATVKREWKAACLWLRHEIRKGDSHDVRALPAT